MIIFSANQKGWGAKSTTATNLSAGLALEGYKVLLIDTGAEANSTKVFIHPDVEAPLEKSRYGVIINFSPLSSVIRKTNSNNLSFVPAHIRLSGIDLELAQAIDNRSERMKRALEAVKEQFDYIIIDTLHEIRYRPRQRTMAILRRAFSILLGARNLVRRGPISW